MRVFAGADRQGYLFPRVTIAGKDVVAKCLDVVGGRLVEVDERRIVTEPFAHLHQCRVLSNHSLEHELRLTDERGELASPQRVDAFVNDGLRDVVSIERATTWITHEFG